MSARAASALLVTGLLAGAFGCTAQSVRDADVTLTEVVRASVVTPDGRSRAARIGERLRRDVRIVTEDAGSATLDVRGRRVVLAELTTVRVPNGASIDLLSGSVLVDRRRGPGLTLTAGDARLDEIDPGALRVDRGYTARVAVYAGHTRIRNTRGRSVDVDELHEAAASGRALTDAAAPLSLRGDGWEREVIPDVVRLDESIVRLARGVDATEPTATSERVVPIAINRSARLDGGEDAAQLRRAGGSWGVIATLLRADAVGIGRALAALLSPVGPTPPAGPAAPNGTQPPNPSPSATPRPSPSRSPSRSPSPSPSPTGAVERVVKMVEDLLPSPTGSAIAGLAG